MLRRIAASVGPLSKVMATSTPLRFFKSSAICFSDFSPHSEGYVKDQLQVLKERGLAARKVSLKKGTKLVGLNIHFEEELVHDASPLYEEKSLSGLTPKDKKRFIYMHENYPARIVNFEVAEDIECAATETESGASIYFVHDAMIDMSTQRKISKVMDITSPSLALGK